MLAITPQYQKKKADFAVRRGVLTTKRRRSSSPLILAGHLVVVHTCAGGKFETSREKNNISISPRSHTNVAISILPKCSLPIAIMIKTPFHKLATGLSLPPSTPHECHANLMIAAARKHLNVSRAGIFKLFALRQEIEHTANKTITFEQSVEARSSTSKKE